MDKLTRITFFVTIILNFVIVCYAQDVVYDIASNFALDLKTKTEYRVEPLTIEPCPSIERTTNSKEPNVKRTPIDSSTLISDGVFSYSVLGENSVALVSLADNQVLLSGDVIIPAEVQINGKTYYVESVYCSLSDIVDSKGVINLDIQAPFSEIPKSMFYKASQLQSIKFPSTLKSIGSSAFLDCARLTGELVLPEGLTSIGTCAFYGCSGLTGKLVLPESLKTLGVMDYTNLLGGMTFSGCNGFTGDLVLPKGLTMIGYCDFSGCSGFTGNLVLPEGLTSIGDGAFVGCSGFTGNLVLPEGLTSIGDGAFAGCSGFTGELVLPEGLTSIGDGAFVGCSGFTGNLVLPEGLTSIGNNAFSWLNFELYISYAETPGNADEFSFWSTDPNISKILYVPIGSKYAYANASGWNFFKDYGKIIEGTPAESIILDKTLISLQTDESTKLVATILPETTTNKSVIWMSSDESVATVDTNGLVTAKAVGEATITASTTDGSNLTATCKITVLTSIDGVSDDNIVVATSGDYIIVSNAPKNVDVNVYSNNGTLIRSVKSAGETISINISSIGIYYVKVGNKTVKVII